MKDIKRYSLTSICKSALIEDLIKGREEKNKNKSEKTKKAEKLVEIGCERRERESKHQASE